MYIYIENMDVCAYLCIFSNAHTHTYNHTNLHTHTHTHTNMNTLTHTLTSKGVYVYMNTDMHR